MLLADVNSKIDEMMSTLMTSIDKEGAEQFLSDPNAIKRHLKIEDKDLEELTRESVFYAEHSDFEHAAETLGYLMFFEPFFANHYLRLGAILLILKQHENAFKILEVGFALDPSNPEYALYMGNCLLALGQKEPAKKAFNECLELSKRSSRYDHIAQLATEALHGN